VQFSIVIPVLLLTSLSSLGFRSVVVKQRQKDKSLRLSKAKSKCFWRKDVLEFVPLLGLDVRVNE